MKARFLIKKLYLLPEVEYNRGDDIYMSVDLGINNLILWFFLESEARLFKGGVVHKR